MTLQAPAPQEAGDYTWEAAWYGANNLGSDHYEVRTPVTIHVEIDLGAEDFTDTDMWKELSTYDPTELVPGLNLNISPSSSISRRPLACIAARCGPRATRLTSAPALASLAPM